MELEISPKEVFKHIGSGIRNRTTDKINAGIGLYGLTSVVANSVIITSYWRYGEAVLKDLDLPPFLESSATFLKIYVPLRFTIGALCLSYGTRNTVKFIRNNQGIFEAE